MLITKPQIETNRLFLWFLIIYIWFVKRCLYPFRTALAGKWTLLNNTFPTVDFIKLLLITAKHTRKSKRLMEIKANQNETYLHPK